MKRLLLALSVMLSVVFAAPALAAPTTTSPTSGSSKESVCAGVGLTGGDCDKDANEATVGGTIKTVISILTFAIGIIAVIMIIIGGLKYIMSSGDSNSVNSAKNTILWALVGLVVVIVAQVIVRFVVRSADPDKVTPTTTSFTRPASELEAVNALMI